MEPKVFSSGKIRQARGFSLSELKKANIDIRKAKKIGVRIDHRRRTVYDENVRLLAKKGESKKKGGDKGAKERSKKLKEGKLKKSSAVKKSKTTE
ncbi:MAG: ribosomal protein L13e [Thermoplasmata archaeon]|nr:MAG: ribosomal protein L13e [Thermoplasmata archaeon]